mmetsp:Transcript_20752/g.69606  ORF Transcript_20752/g.69606 Transcript_20752/m.69606 type:complete len:216 (-) Transcript_20752:843-1490(-)
MAADVLRGHEVVREHREHEEVEALPPQRLHPLRAPREERGLQEEEQDGKHEVHDHRGPPQGAVEDELVEVHGARPGAPRRPGPQDLHRGIQRHDHPEHGEEADHLKRKHIHSAEEGTISAGGLERAKDEVEDQGEADGLALPGGGGGAHEGEARGDEQQRREEEALGAQVGHGREHARGLVAARFGHGDILEGAAGDEAVRGKGRRGGAGHEADL